MTTPDTDRHAERRDAEDDREPRDPMRGAGCSGEAAARDADRFAYDLGSSWKRDEEWERAVQADLKKERA